GSQVIVLTPTRELAVQVADQLKAFAKRKKLSTAVIFGGMSIERQIKDLKRKPEIIVGTPGRMIDHSNRRTLKLDCVVILVLDETDAILSMVDIDDVSLLMSKVRDGGRQTLLFPAPLPRAIQGLVTRFMKNPTVVKAINQNNSDALVDEFHTIVKGL